MPVNAIVCRGSEASDALPRGQAAIMAQGAENPWRGRELAMCGPAGTVFLHC